jgi:predicted Zn-dependent protease
MSLVKPSLLARFAVLLVAILLAGCTAEQRKARALSRADEYYRAGELDQASVEYTKVLSFEPKNARANERLGLIWLEQGSPLRAGSYLTEAIAARPSDHDLKVKMAQVLLGVGKVDAARPEVLKVLASDPDNGEAMILLAECVRTPDDLIQAEKTLKESPDQVSASYHLASASLSLRRGKVAEAKASLQRALAADSRLPAVHSALGAFYQWQNKPTEAGKAYKDAMDAAPLRSAARLTYAEFLVQTNAGQEAITLLEATVASAPDYLPAWIALARLRYVAKQYPEALAQLQKVLARDADNYSARLLQCRVWIAQGEIPKGIEGLQRLDQIYPGLAPAKHELAQIYLRNKQPADAVRVLREAVAAQPDYTPAVLTLAELDLQMGQPEAALSAMVDLLQRQPNLFRAQLLLAAALQRMGRLDDAAKVIREQIRVAPDHGSLYFLLGVIQLQQKDPAAARGLFEQALQRTPGYLPAITQLADLDLRERKFDEATQRIETFLKDNPTSLDGQYLAARILAVQGNWTEANRVLRQLIAQDSNYSQAYSLLLYGLITTNQLAQVAVELEALHAKTPDNVPVLVLSGLVYGQLGENAKARKAYEAVLAIRPDASLSLNNLALLYLEDPVQLDRATELARKARELEPESPAIADTLGWILYLRKDHDGALPMLKFAAGGLPDNGEVQYHLGMACKAKGDTAGARLALTKAAAAKEDFKGKDQIAGELAALP